VPGLCRSAVDFAAKAQQQYLSANASRRPKIALCMGSFGSSIATAAEYHGIYPPPFGPVSVSALGNTPESLNVKTPPSHAALNATAEGEAQAEHALFEWHLERLRMYADDEDVWKKVDVLAFETIPLAREARAIRRAVSELFSSGTAVKPWWMSFTFPEGNLPQKQYAGGPPVTTEQLLEAIFSPLNAASGSQGKRDLSTPPAIGVNCTAPSLIPELVESMSNAMLNMVPSPGSVEGLQTTNEQPNINSPWLVVYPNGRHIYEPSLRRWVEPSEEEGGSQGSVGLMTSSRWAQCH
jgi:homocysteine S-methyltransferase